MYLYGTPSFIKYPINPQSLLVELIRNEVKKKYKKYHTFFEGLTNKTSKSSISLLIN